MIIQLQYAIPDTSFVLGLDVEVPDGHEYKIIQDTYNIHIQVDGDVMMEISKEQPWPTADVLVYGMDATYLGRLAAAVCVAKAIIEKATVFYEQPVGNVKE